MSVRSWMVARRQFSGWMPPFGFFVDCGLGHAAEGTNGAAISTDRRTRHLRPGWLIHKRHELVREAGHGAADADAADVGAAADSGHPSAFGNVAVHHRTPASELHDALGRAVHFGEVALLVVTGAITAFVDRFAEQPSRTQFIVERNHGREPGNLVEQVENGF